MTLLNIQQLTLTQGASLLLDHVSLQIERGEKVCLIGRNGVGKSTLLNIIAGQLTPDSGEFIKSPGLRIARLTQEIPQHLTGSVTEVVAQGLGEIGQLIAEFHALTQQLEQSSETRLLNKLEKVQHALEAVNGWDIQQRVDEVISRLELPTNVEFSQLSGGLKRRVLLGQALVNEPDLLLLDEPTNHLDIEAIQWLEKFFINYPAALLFITHDRQFLQKLATRIIELDRGKLTSYPGDYLLYLKQKEAALEAEAREQALFDKKLAEEEVWIRQGIKARRTRNEGRVRALKKLRQLRSERRQHIGQVKMITQESELSGKLLIEAKNVSYQYDNQILINNFSTVIARNDKIGIIGPNGCGKTTLIRLLLGEINPTRGTIRQGTKLEIAYFDQLRAQLEENKTVQENVSGGKENVIINGKARHVISYLQDFLFSPERARSSVNVLSGGERNRLLLAKLFTKPANLIVLDEPTNDLDIETLELLEQLLIDYNGTLLLISHDREFLNNVVTSVLAFEGRGQVNEYIGGYDDWILQRSSTVSTKEAIKSANNKITVTISNAPARKLSYKEQQELEKLPKLIENLEKELNDLQIKLADPEFYKKSKDEVATFNKQVQQLQSELENNYNRWEELENKFQ